MKLSLVARLDAFATDDPGFNEGHPEDRCPLCELPVVDHPTWRHRRRAAWALLISFKR